MTLAKFKEALRAKGLEVQNVWAESVGNMKMECWNVIRPSEGNILIIVQKFDRGNGFSVFADTENVSIDADVQTLYKRLEKKF